MAMILNILLVKLLSLSSTADARTAFIMNKSPSPQCRRETFSIRSLSSSADPIGPAYPQQTPHAGCHFRPTHPGSVNHKSPIRRKRFFEGWYFRITLPDDNASFAFIFSIEDPQGSPLSLSCCQIMGPNDDYLIQSDPDPTKFWAWQHQQGLGCTFAFNNDDITNTHTTMIDPDVYDSTVQTGFQMTPTRLQGKIVGDDGTEQRVPSSCDFDMTIQPLAGWGGDATQPQQSTAGWLARYAVFEPHWQVTLADARATGTVRWKNSTYTFNNIPFYAEKNWGGAFPIKWYWTQCNAFDDYLHDKSNSALAVTAGGGIRKLPGGQTESLGMVAVHYNGIMYEATPWLGTMEWDVRPWGEWILTGRSTKGERPFEVALHATCDVPGVVLRAPTEKEGMVYFCRDSFRTNATLWLWELVWDATNGEYVRGKAIIDGATSKHAAVEVGGGPWWDRWKGQSRMKQPFKALVRFPYRVANWKKRLLSK